MLYPDADGTEVTAYDRLGRGREDGCGRRCEACPGEGAQLIRLQLGRLAIEEAIVADLMAERRASVEAEMRLHYRVRQLLVLMDACEERNAGHV